MESLLRFLVFVVFVSLLVAGVFFLRSTTTQPLLPPPATTTSSSALPSSALLERDREFADLVNRVMPSVVSITAVQQPLTANTEFFRFFGDIPELPPQLGSGVIVSRKGHIITNLHVIGNGSAVVQAHLSDGRTVTAQIIGVDPFTDLAVLKINNADGDFTPLELGNSDDVRVGQTVFAVGNPYGLEETVTCGIISAKGRRGFSERMNEFFQTDVAVNPGNSGGPLIDMNGKIIAINNSILANKKGASQGISFAIPANTVKRVFKDIQEHGRVIHTWFGVITFSLTESMAQQLGIPNQRGVFVYGILQNSPAQRAGLYPGDVIIQFNGKNIYDDIDLRNRVAETVVGQKVNLRFLRHHSEKQIEVIIEKRPGI